MNASEFNVTENDSEEIGEMSFDPQMISNATLHMVMKAAYSGVIPTLAVAGLICNFFSLVLLCPIKERSTTNVYLIGLTVCDVWILLNAILICSTAVLDLHGSVAVKRVRNLMVPVFLTYVSPLPGSISNYLVTLIAVERFVAVVFPLKVRLLCDRRFAVFAVLACYFIPAIISFPLSLLYQTKEVISNQTGAVIDEVVLTEFGKDKYTVDILYVTTVVLLRFTPVLLVAAASTTTAISLLCQSRRSLLRSNRITTRPKEAQVTITLLVLTTSFLLTNLPSTINRCIMFLRSDIYMAQRESNFHWMLMVCWYILYVANSCVNFPIYVITCKAYREQFLKIMCNKLPNKSGKYMFQREPISIAYISR